MPKSVTRPLSARLVLLAAAAALALSLVWALAVAEHRDSDTRPVKRSVAIDLRAPAPQDARAVAVRAQR